jgi:hypothetical protein
MGLLRHFVGNTSIIQLLAVHPALGAYTFASEPNNYFFDASDVSLKAFEGSELT